MSRWWLCVVVVLRVARRERRVTTLAVALIAASMVDLVLAWTWLQGTLILGAWIMVAVLMYSAIAAASPVRREAVNRLATGGATTGVAPLVAVVHSVLLCVAGAVVGILVGLVVRAPLVNIAPPTLANDTRGVIEASVTSAAFATAFTALAAAIASLADPMPKHPRVRRLWSPLRLVLSIVALTAGIVWTGGSSFSFSNLELSLLLFAPVIALGAVGLASSVLSGVLALLRGRGGVSWFVVRALSRQRVRATPVLALVTITVTICATGAILTSSLHERVEQARTELSANPAWVAPDGLFDQVDCDTMPPDLRDACTMGRHGPETLSRTGLALQDPAAEWVLILAALVLTLPLIVLAVSLDTAARADEDELLDLQGAAPTTRRQVSVLTATLLSSVGSVTGVAIAVVGTGVSIAIYNNQARLHAKLLYPTVPFVVPLAVLAALVVLVPATAAAVTAVGPRLTRSVPRLDLAHRVEQPVSLR